VPQRAWDAVAVGWPIGTPQPIRFRDI